MSWFVAGFSVVVITVVAGIMIAMPALVRPTVPLGVDVPRDRLGEPVIRSAIGRYRIGIAGGWVVSVASTIGFAAALPAAAISVPTFLLVVIGMLSYLGARSVIVRAKRDGRWYDGVRVRLTADVTAQAHEATHPPVAWSIVALLILLAVAAIGVVLYPGMPDRLPMHWNSSGQIDSYAAKSVWTMFTPILFGLGVVVLLFACSFLVRLSPGRAVASDSPAQAARRAREQRHLLSGLFGQLSVVIALLFAFVAIAMWTEQVSGLIIAIAMTVFLGLLVAVLIVFMVRYARPVTEHAAATDAGSARGADAPDDDHLWKAGFLYVNRDDPAVWVPKRFGVGWTVNLGHPVGAAIGLLLLALIVGGVAVAILAPKSEHPF